MTANSQQDVGTPNSERPRSFFAKNSASYDGDHTPVEPSQEDKGRPTKWSMGVLNDPETHEVPGSVLLLTGQRNEPLGLRNAPARTSASSLPQPPPAAHLLRQARQASASEGKKKTKDGAIILEPQPDDSHNDPLNWPTWKRDSALLSLGLYCMVGGGMTPILAAGFTNVAATYDVTTPEVALTTGLYMMGLGLGSVIVSPTAILYGKRPVYLISAVLFIGTSVWCALSPNYASLVVARIVQGVSVAPVECLPSATIAEIFFLHERAYRIGIYTLLLLGGKNLVPLVSAAIIQSLGWRWVFWVVAMVVGFCWVLLFLFVPETFWDRTPRPKTRKASAISRFSVFSHRMASNALRRSHLSKQIDGQADGPRPDTGGTNIGSTARKPSPERRGSRGLHVGFVQDTSEREQGTDVQHTADDIETPQTVYTPISESDLSPLDTSTPVNPSSPVRQRGAQHIFKDRVIPAGGVPPTPGLHNFNSPFYNDMEKQDSSYFGKNRTDPNINQDTETLNFNHDGGTSVPEASGKKPLSEHYTANLKTRPALTFVQQLKPYNGRLNNDKWFRVMIRPFILFAYPAVLWSSVVYACAVGWLIVLSESVAEIYRSPEKYNFSALSTGLIYLSPFIGGVLGTAVAGKVSDIIVRAMSKRNGGLYEPEFRLVMAAPVAVATVIGLMGFGWSAEEQDAWIVPTLFFGVISFGCSLGSTTAITFCVDSYRQYAGEALVTLNFSKNIFHGLVFSLFFNRWLERSGSKSVFIWLGIIQLVLMAFTIPMYVFGKRARIWTVRKNLMEKL